ncbi:hypothetical protein E5288_WYG014641 [Bos mutus]|uniref:Uncharacterized protein n=1 Tax=Bos mutus TaxID=72004 RepID=A0A6B0R3N2_9CETA|nr:hypothetical protein [Bos mutus]
MNSKHFYYNPVNSYGIVIPNTVAAPGSAPGANRTPFRIHSNADNGTDASRLAHSAFRTGAEGGQGKPAAKLATAEERCLLIGVEPIEVDVVGTASSLQYI